MKLEHRPRLRQPRGSPPTRGAWIETIAVGECAVLAESPPTRGAWIETPARPLGHRALPVAPHAGGVD